MFFLSGELSSRAPREWLFFENEGYTPFLSLSLSLFLLFMPIGNSNNGVILSKLILHFSLDLLFSPLFLLFSFLSSKFDNVTRAEDTPAFFFPEEIESLSCGFANRNTSVHFGRSNRRNARGSLFSVSLSLFFFLFYFNDKSEIYEQR